MTINDDKHRFVVIIDKVTFQEFKELAQKEQRSASNLASKLISDFVKKNK